MSWISTIVRVRRVLSCLVINKAMVGMLDRCFTRLTMFRLLLYTSFTSGQAGQRCVVQRGF